MGEGMALSLVRTITTAKQRHSTSALPDPYHETEQVLLHQLGADSGLEGEQFDGRSYMPAARDRMRVTAFVAPVSCRSVVGCNSNRVLGVSAVNTSFQRRWFSTSTSDRSDSMFLAAASSLSRRRSSSTIRLRRNPCTPRARGANFLRKFHHFRPASIPLGRTLPFSCPFRFGLPWRGRIKQPDFGGQEGRRQVRVAYCHQPRRERVSEVVPSEVAYS